MNRHFFVALIVLQCFAQSSKAQNRNVTVQLPTYRVFGTSTTVIVPDRGSVYLGGVGRSSMGQKQFGPGVPGWGGRGMGRTSSVGGISTSVTIIDHDEIDRALLAEAARRRGADVDVLGRPVANAPRRPSTRLSRRSDVRVRDGRNSLAPRHFRSSAADFARSGQPMPKQSSVESQRVGVYLQRAQQAESEGQPHLAKVFYQRVAKHGDRASKSHAESRLAAIATADKHAH